jgi:hypothetical protein
MGVDRGRSTPSQERNTVSRSDSYERRDSSSKRSEFDESDFADDFPDPGSHMIGFFTVLPQS